MSRVLLPFASFLAALLLRGGAAAAEPPFEGRLEAVVTRGEERTALLYTLGADVVRVEIAADSKAEPVNLLDRKSGELTLVFLHNRSFLRVPRETPGLKIGPAPPALPPRPAADAAGVPAPPALPAMPVMPTMPAPFRPPAELKPTGKTETILGLDCAQFEITERGETIEVWATAALGPFQPYVRAPAPRYGPVPLEAQWAAQLATRKLFPLRAVLRDETPDVRFRWEVKAIAPGKVADGDGKLFGPPESYAEFTQRPF